VTKARERRQLKIVVVLDIAFSDSELNAPHTRETSELLLRRDFARESIRMYDAIIVRDFEPFSIMEFGSVVLAFDSISKIRTILNEMNNRSEVGAEEDPIYPRFSCHVAETPVEQPLLESAVVRKAIEMLKLANLGEVVVSGTVFDMLPKHQAEFIQYDPDTFVMGGNSNLPIAEKCRADPSRQRGAQENGRREHPTLDVANELTPAEGNPPGDDDITIVCSAFSQNNDNSTGAEPSTKAGAAAISAGEEAILSGNNLLCYRALAEIHRLTNENQRMDDLPLSVCRANIEAALSFSGAAVYVIKKRPYILQIKSAIEIGRRTLTRLDDIHVGCGLVSKIGRQTRIEYRDKEFCVTDQGSTNGTFLNQSHVTPGEWGIIKNRAKIHIGGGLKPPRPGLCMLACKLIGGEQPALVMEFHTNRMDPADLEKIFPHWRTVHLDSEYRWVLAPGGILIGSGATCAIKASADESGVAAEITFNNGYFIKPRGNSELLIAGEPFATEVTLADNTEISINGTIFQFYSSASYFKDSPPNSINE
jgi:hypothetical protein